MARGQTGGAAAVLLEKLLVRVCELRVQSAYGHQRRMAAAETHLLPLGLQFSLGPDTRLHGYAPRRGGEVDRRSVIYMRLAIGELTRRGRPARATDQSARKGSAGGRIDRRLHGRKRGGRRQRNVEYGHAMRAQRACRRLS